MRDELTKDLQREISQNFAGVLERGENADEDKKAPLTQDTNVTKVSAKSRSKSKKKTNLKSKKAATSEASDSSAQGKSFKV